MLLTIKKQQQELGNKDQKIEKTTFKKVWANNFRKVRKVDGHKDTILTCKPKSHQKKTWHKDWNQSFYPEKTKHPRFLARNLVCLRKNDDVCKKKNKTNTFHN